MPAQPKATLEKLLELLGFPATVEEHKMEDGILLDVKSEDSGRLIGRQGQTLSDLQYIANRLLKMSQNLLMGQKLSEYHSGYRGFSEDALLIGDVERVAERMAELGAMGYTDVIIRNISAEQPEALATIERLAQVQERVSAL